MPDKHSRRSYRVRPASERFWPKVSKSTDADGCWLWLGGGRGRGYGAFKISGKKESAHKVSYEMAYGPVPEGLFVCHRCDVRRCVRPDHLFVGTAEDNSRDMSRKGRGVAGDPMERAARYLAAFIRHCEIHMGTPAFAEKFAPIYTAARYVLD
jgi:hypothetical protein